MTRTLILFLFFISLTISIYTIVQCCECKLIKPQRVCAGVIEAGQSDKFIESNFQDEQEMEGRMVIVSR